MQLARSLLVCAALVAGTSSARASDWYVDAVGGSNANAGSTPGAAWQTVTHALATIPAGPQAIHLLPGLYDAALGESFPLTLPTDLELLGATEPAAVQVVVPANTVAFVVSPFGATTLAALTVRSAGAQPTGTGISMAAFTPGTPADVTLRDLVVESFGTGVFASNENGFTPSSTIRMERVEIAGCGTGVVLVNDSNGFGLTASLLDSCVRDCGTGLFADNFEGFTLGIGVQRCRFLDNAVAGLRLRNLTSVSSIFLSMRDSLVAGGGCDGITAYGSQVQLDGCTLAGNACVGFEQSGVACCASSLYGSILYGNGDDLATLTPLVPAECNIGDGDFLGINGNIAVDPKFADPAGGDYRPGFTSACIDRLPAASSTTDLAGLPRDNDGDLDLAAGRDLGAYELRNLTAPMSVPLGEFWGVELFGPPGESSVLMISRSGLLSAPIVSSFGSRWLPTGGTVAVGPLLVQGSGPQTVTLPLPAVPALVGTTLGLQAFTRNPAAPAGGAWGETAEVLVVP